MGFLRFVVWSVLLIIVVSIIFTIFVGSYYQTPAPQHYLEWNILNFKQTPSCTESVYVDPWTVVNSFGLSVENNQVVFRYTNTSEEAEKVLSDASIEPETYYYYYSILTALVVEPRGSSTIYELHPLPVSQSDSEGLAEKSLCFYLPKGFEVPAVNASLVAEASYIIKNVTVLEWSPVFRAYVPKNRTVFINTATYLPTGNATFAVSASFLQPLEVEGFAELLQLDAEVLGYEVCGEEVVPWLLPGGGVVYEYREHLCAVYSVGYRFAVGYTEGDRGAEAVNVSGARVFRVDRGRDYVNVTEPAEALYRGWAVAVARLVARRIELWECSTWSLGACTNSTVYHRAVFELYSGSRKLVLYPAKVDAVANFVEMWSGVLSTAKITVSVNRSTATLPVNASRILNISVVAYPWEEKELRVDIYLSDVVAIAGSRLINFTRTVRVASMNISVSKPSTDPGGWGWGTAVELKPVIEVSTWSIEKPYVNITKVLQLLKPNPAELWLEKLVLRYIHDKIAQFIANSSTMSSYRDAYLWLLATQIPISMSNCTRDTATPLLDALCSKCGPEAEKVRILCNIASYTLETWIVNASLYWPSYSSTAVEAVICVAEIDTYPSLWELYNKSKNVVFAKPSIKGYLVFYNAYENSPFGDWTRIAQ